MDSIRVLKNIFVLEAGNFLFPADLYFTDRIEKIERLHQKSFPFEEITAMRVSGRIGQLFPERDFPIAAEIFDGNFLLAMPGGIDPHVHFDTPGFEFREDFLHGSLAAAFGGTTTVIDMPCTSIPPVTSAKNLNVKLEALKNRSYVDYALWGGVAGNQFDEAAVSKNIEELNRAGVAGYKVYMISGMASFEDLSTEQILTTARLVSKTRKPLAVHAEDKEMISFKTERFEKMKIDDWHSYCKARDEQAEAEAISKLLHAAENSGCKIHIVHLSSALGLSVVRQAQKHGLKISAETCPHYLFFTQKDFENDSIRNFLKTAPPVKFEADRDELWSGLANGSLSFITTDHAGCDPAVEKSSSKFSEIYGGIPGVEHRVPFLFSEGFLKGKLSLARVIELLSGAPAEFFGLKQKGRLAENYDADIALIDLWKRSKVESDKMHSKGKYTPFEGVNFNATVDSVFLRGVPIIKPGGYFINNQKRGNFIPCN